MSKKIDFTNYGAFKESYAHKRKFASLAEKIGLKNRYLKFLSGFSRNLLVVEIGCGNGSFIQAMIKSGFEKIVGLEPSPSYKPVVTNGLIVQEYANEFFCKLPEGSVGGVVAWDVFEHIAYADIKDLFVKIRMSLVQGGRLVIRVPNMSSPFGMVNFYGDISHVSPLNEHTMRQLAFETGMVLEGVYPEPFSYPKNLFAVLGCFVWPMVNLVWKLSYAAFGVKVRVFTPNVIFVLGAK